MDNLPILQSLQELNSKRLQKAYPTYGEFYMLRIMDGYNSFTLDDVFKNALIPVNFKEGNRSSGIIDIVLSHESALQYSDLMKQFLVSVMEKCKIKKVNETLQILDKIVNDDSLNNDPDNMSEFRFLKDNIGNDILSFLEIYRHPITLAAGLVNIPAQRVVRPFLKDNPEHVHNLDTMNKYVYRGTLVDKRNFYENILKESLTEYAKFTKLVRQGCPIKFRWNLQKHSFGLTEIEKYVPQDNLVHIFDCLNRMYNIARTG